MSETDKHTVPPTEVVEAFTAAAITALQELTRLEAYSDSSPQATALASENVVVATLRLLRNVPGKLTVALTETTASQLAAIYLPQGTALSDEMIDDVVGEFANVIAGQAKTILNGTPYHFTLSTPVVAREASSILLSVNAQRSLITAMNFELGQMLLFLDLPPCPGA